MFDLAPERVAVAGLFLCLLAGSGSAACSDSADSGSCEGAVCTTVEGNEGDTGGTSGASGATGGANLGGAAPTSSTGGASVAGTPGITAGSAGAPDLGPAAACGTEGERRCAGQAQTAFIACTNGAWSVGNCEPGFLCDNSSGACEEVFNDCARYEPGEGFCDGSELVVCGPDLVSVEREPCGDGGCEDGACLEVKCGDGIPVSIEECDDGNDVDTDDCTNDCLLPRCGDGIVHEDEEECDDGNDTETDACRSTCKLAVCGDGAAWTDHEACDDGNDIDDDGCPSNCQEPRCGDGYVVRGIEDCDDENELGADGCSAECRVEPASIDLGGEHSCAILKDGRLKCWGSNEFGQLGFGTASSDPVGDSLDELGANLPVVLEGPVQQVAAGGTFTCALVDEEVFCWGANQRGQLGRGLTASTVVAPGPVDVGGEVAEVCTGHEHACARLTSGAVKCWGSAEFGQIAVDPAAIPRPYLGSAPAEMGSNLGAVDLDAAATTVACGGFFSCALLETGFVYCWGDGREGQLGPIEGEFLADPKYIAMNYSLFVPEHITLGNQHVCTWISGDGRCWGFNRYGQLARETSLSFGLNPQDFANWDRAGLVGGTSFQAISAGYNTTCVLADNDVRCFGENFQGSLGISNRPDIGHLGDEPQEGYYGVDPLRFRSPSTKGALAISTGNYHGCALLNTGVVACWGDNSKGQLGMGSAAAADLAITDTVGELPVEADIN